MLTRRNLLALGGYTAAAAVLGVGEVGRRDAGPVRAARVSELPQVTPFAVPMPVPPVLRPVATDGDTDFYQLAIQRAQVEIFPGTSTEVLSYGGGAVGPTIHATVGRRTVLDVRNDLAAHSNVHLHGGHVPAAHDGHPMDLITPGGTRRYEYPNTQRGGTLWYHDHSHHSESEHVYRGLHGMYVLTDHDEAGLGLPGGAYDIPVVLRDGHFDAAATLLYDMVDPSRRNTLLANGQVQPYLPVAPRRYRLRLLNASVNRVLTLDLDGVEMVQIAADASLLPAPVVRTALTLGPAERAEIVVDFAAHGGRSVVLSDRIGPVLRFDVGVTAGTDDSRIPDQLRPLPDPLPATVLREFRLRMDGATHQGFINDQPFNTGRVDARIQRGATEIWTIANDDRGLPHTFHPHLVQFRVLDRDGVPPPPGETGLKDTIYIGPKETVRIQATFEGEPGRYPFHCHMLDHPGMMSQFEIVQ